MSQVAVALMFLVSSKNFLKILFWRFKKLSDGNNFRRLLGKLSKLMAVLDWGV